MPDIFAFPYMAENSNLASKTLPFKPLTIHHYVHKSKAYLINGLNTALKEMNTTGRIQEIFELMN